MKTSGALPALYMLFAVASHAGAQHQHADDVHLAFENGQLVTGVIHDRDFEPARLWIVDIDDDVTDDPGYEAEAGTFELNSTVGIVITKALRKWNEVEEHFEDIADSTMVISRFDQWIETPASDPEPSEWLGLPLAMISAGGSLHVHPFYALMPPADDGIYLLELRFWNTLALMPVTFISDPFYVIFTKNVDDEEAIHEAEEWVESYLLDPTEPATCPEDITGDNVVDIFDLLEVLAAWGPCPQNQPCPADLTSDGVVDIFDLLAVLAAWGPCPQ